MTDIDFRKILNPEQYRVMRERDTERPYSGKYWDHDEGGLYACAACGNVLFSSLTKRDAENGWPTFTAPFDKGSVVLLNPGADRSEIVCGTCRSHIGHLVTPERKSAALYVVNSASLAFTEFPEVPEKDEEDKKEEQHKKETTALKKQIQNVLVLVAAVLTGAGLGYASGTAMCRTFVSPAQSPSPTPSVSVVPTTTPTTSILAPSPTPRPSALGTPPPTVSVAPVASGSADGTVPTP